MCDVNCISFNTDRVFQQDFVSLFLLVIPAKFKYNNITNLQKYI